MQGSRKRQEISHVFPNWRVIIIYCNTKKKKEKNVCKLRYMKIVCNMYAKDGLETSKFMNP